jgi:hypothetical protein
MERPRSGWTLESVNDDVFHEICKAILDTTCSDEQGKPITGHQSIKSLSAANLDMRKRLEPIVFKSIYIDVRSWYITLNALKLIENCQAVQHYTKRFHLRIYEAAPGSLESVDGLPRQFATVLSTLKRLEKIRVDVPKNEAPSYRLAAQKSQVELASVRTLESGPQMQWMIELCPHVTTIRICQYWPLHGVPSDRRSYHFVRSAGLAKQLQTFEMEVRWTAELVESVYSTMPHLQSLALLGRRQHFKLKELLPPLSCFRNLKTLSVPRASQLGVGFCPPGCGNAYMGPDGEKVRRRVKEEERRAEQRASRMIFSSCPQLKVLWIGNKEKSRTMQDDSPVVGEGMILSKVHPLSN